MAAAAAALFVRSSSMRGLFRDGRVVHGVLRIQRVNVVHRQPGQRLAVADGLRDVDLDRVDESDVVHDDAHCAAVWHAAGFPLRVRQGGGERGKRLRTLFETGGQRLCLAGDSRSR